MPIRPATALQADLDGTLAPCVRPLVAVRHHRGWRAVLPEGVLTFGDEPIDRAGGIASRSAVPGCHAEMVASKGRIGLDVETLARIALNAAPGDPWLAPCERRIVAAASDPLIELAGRWVLREAYGKALGVGLAMPLDTLVFQGRGDRITLCGVAEGWSFALYRCGDTMFGIARQATPFAPIGRNPPAPPFDR
ncbi:4'-phosphopantetheinyl transferase superfamily protein [Sphingomonas sp. PB1R3]|uniref:4'-phosphopantetheinyl transferase superfamily protein n=1 Tax=Sphingomonas flavida TaxID=3096154 RepID=UPI002FC5ADA3